MHHLSTCNRLEIWASHEDEQELSLYQCLCELRNIQDPSYEEYFISREDKEAVEHLFYLAGGLKSQILGEDQILTQIKDALNLAREHFTTDSVLEVLFRMAVTAGQKDQDRSSACTWKSVCDPSGSQQSAGTGI